MSSGLNSLTWTFTCKYPFPKSAERILTPEENALAAYKTIKLFDILTNKRLIIKEADIQSAKNEIFSLPLTSIKI